MNTQPYLGPDLQVRKLDEHIERVGDPSVGRIFERDQAEFNVAAIDLLEDGGDRTNGDVLDAFAKFRDRRQVAVTVLWSKIRDANCPLKGSRAAHQLAKDNPQGVLRQRSLAGAQDLGDDLVFPRRRPDLKALIVLRAPIWETISARRLSRLTRFKSSRSISPRKLVRLGWRLGSGVLGAGARSFGEREG